MAQDFAFQTNLDSPPPKPAVEDNTAHVWAVTLDRDTLDGQVLAQTLAEDELARADRFRAKKARAHFIAARGSLRVILAKYVGCSPGELAFVYGEQGKPALADPWDQSGVTFNVSHSNGLALIAICAGCEIGVDVEHQSRRVGQKDHIAKRFFAEGEYKMLKALPEGHWEQAFFNCWTRKEAFVKATGLGLAHSLKDFQVSLDADAKLLVAKGVDVGQWTMQHLELGEGYVGAVAIAGPDVDVTCWAVG